MTDFDWITYNKEYAEKDYIYADWLKAAIKILQPKTILEVGAGLQRNRKYIDDSIQYTGIDLIDGHDLTEMESYKYYDLVLSTGFFCHIEPSKREQVMDFMTHSGKYIIMIEPYTEKPEMHEWHGEKDKLWTVNPEMYQPIIFTRLKGGYSLAIF